MSDEFPNDDIPTEVAVTHRRLILLEQFDLISEEDLAVLLNVNIRTLRNKSILDLPSFTKVGQQRLFYKDSVREFLAARKVEARRIRRISPPLGAKKGTRPATKPKVRGGTLASAPAP